MTTPEDYKNLINDIIAKQVVILGPDIALLKAKNVAGLKLSPAGQVVSIEGDPHQVLQALIDEYIALSGQIVRSILKEVFAKYPEIQIPNS